MVSTDTLPILASNLSEYLNGLAAKIKNDSTKGYGDSCKGAEVVIRNLMNLLYDYQLKLEEKVNASGFDLCDIDKKVLVQVTVNCTDDKVEDCLRTTNARVAANPDLKNSTLYIMFLTVDDKDTDVRRRNAANKLGKPEPGDTRKPLKAFAFPPVGYKFDPKTGILNLNTLLEQVRDDKPASGGTLSTDQFKGLHECLQKFHRPVYLAEEICRQFPHKRPLYLPDKPGSLCLHDIYQMLIDDTDDWAMNIQHQLGISTMPPHAETFAILPFQPASGKEFLQKVLSDWIMDDINQKANRDPGIYDQVMDGSYPDDLREKICRDLTQDCGYRFRTTVAKCNAIGADTDAFIIRANLLMAMLETEQHPYSPVRNWYTQCQIGTDHCSGLAPFILYSLLGHQCFSRLNYAKVTCSLRR